MGANEVIILLKEMGAVSKETAVNTRQMCDRLDTLILPSGYKRGLLVLRKERGICNDYRITDITRPSKRYGKIVVYTQKKELEYFWVREKHE